MRRPQPDEGGHEVDAAGVRHRGRDLLGLGGGAQDAQARRAAIARRRRPRRRCLRWQTAAGRRSRPRGWPAGGGAKPAAARRCAAGRSIPCRRCSSRARRGSRPARPAPPAGRRQSRRWGSPRPGARMRRHADHAAGRHDARQHGARDVEDAQQVVVPLARLQVHQHGAGGVGVIRDVQRAVGELPDQPGVDVAEQQFAVAGPLRRRRARGRESSGSCWRKNKRRSPGRSCG